MKIYAAFVLATAIIAVIAEGTDIEEASFQYEYTTLEAKEVGESLKEYITTIYFALEEYLQGLSTTCSTAVSLEKYNHLLRNAEASKCIVEIPNGYENAEKTIANAASECRDSKSVDDLAILISEVNKAQSKVISLDKLLSENTKLCLSKILDEMTCAENKKAIVGKLKDILSHAGSAKFGNLVRNAYFNTKAVVDTCMDTETESLKIELDLASETMKDCLNN